MANNNALSKASLADDTAQQVAAFNANVDARTAEINGWFADRLAWLDQLEDSYMKKHLKKELEKRMGSINASL